VTKLRAYVSGSINLSLRGEYLVLQGYSGSVCHVKCSEINVSHRNIKS
jgi:hypothetical protein